MRVLVIGGAGYVGSKLVPALLKKGYNVVVYDLYLYGDVFKDIKNSKLKEIKGDVRDFKKMEKALFSSEIVIHLACISNDPSFELDKKLGKSINFDSFEPFLELCKKHKIKRFIYASSSSVYGIKKEKNVKEEMELLPLTDYSKYKAMCEKVLLKYRDDFVCTILRPSTVCGYAKRQRLDLVVNILTNLAYHRGKIKIMGGEQMRPNIHIDDMVRAYIHVMEEKKEKVNGEIFNVGYDNYKVIDIGKMVKKLVSKKRDVKIEIIKSNDNRSYHINSEKIKKKLGFIPLYKIEKAILDLIKAFEENKIPNPDDDRYFNIKMMKKVNLK